MEVLTAGLAPMDGVRVGHWTNGDARTGCTVIRFDRPALTAVDVRGAAPGSRELDLLRHGMTVQRPDAILLTGGSAFGLASAEGVVRWMREHGRGFPTSAGPVPIVPGAVVFDLAVGTRAWPDADAGYEATDAAVSLDRMEAGRVGAGTGVTVGAIGGPDMAHPGGFVAAQVRLDDGTVTAIAVVNAFGALRAGAATDPRLVSLAAAPSEPPQGEATTLMACVTDLPVSHEALSRMTVAMHDGLARMIAPVHTIADGDVAFACTTREDASCPTATTLRASLAAEVAIETAIGSLHTGTRNPSGI